MDRIQNEDSGADDASSSLGESSYDFIDDRSVSATDDGSNLGISESLASLADITEDTDNSASHNTIIPAENALHPDDDYGYRISEAAEDGQEAFTEHDTNFIVFPEQEHNTYGHYITRDVSQALKVDPSSYLSERALKVSLRQSLSSRTISLRQRPFKILYWGGRSKKLKDAILHKIATALAVSEPPSRSFASGSRSARFNIFPITPIAHSENPEVVLIDSSGIELDLEEVQSIRPTQSCNTDAFIAMTLKSGETLKFSINEAKSAEFHGWTAPDLAIMDLSETDSSCATRESKWMQSFLNRHGIPWLPITEQAPLEEPSEPMSINEDLPHLHVEGTVLSGTQLPICQRIPIDINHFLRLEAGQLNRSIACVLVSEDFTCRKPPARGAPGKSYTSLSTKLGLSRLQPLSLQIQPTVTIVAIIAVSLMLVPMCSLPESVNVWRQPVPAKAIVSMTDSIATLKPSTARLTTSQIVPAQIVQVENELHARQTLGNSKVTIPKPEVDRQLYHFDVRRLGNSHIIVKVPQSLVEMRKAPLLHFRLTRSAAPVDFSLSHRSNHIYTLRVAQEDARGPLSMSIWTSSHPSLSERFEIDFGRQWPSIAAWEHAGSNLLALIKAGLPRRLRIQTRYGHEGFNRVLSSRIMYDVKQRLATELAHHTDRAKLWVTRATADAVNTWAILGRFTENVRGRLTSYKVSSENTLSNYDLGSAFTEVLKVGWSRIVNARGSTTREAQKMALKAWWRLQEIVLDVTN